MNTPYGQECIVDVHDTRRFFNREGIREFCIDLCKLLGMEPEDLVFWDYEGEPEEYERAPVHLKGTSAVQFIKTSNITIHALSEMARFYLNVFSCKPFDSMAVVDFTLNWTRGRLVNLVTLTRV